MADKLDLSAIANFDKAALKKTETKKKKRLPTKEQIEAEKAQQSEG